LKRFSKLSSVFPCVRKNLQKHDLSKINVCYRVISRKIMVQITDFLLTN